MSQQDIRIAEIEERLSKISPYWHQVGNSLGAAYLDYEGEPEQVQIGSFANEADCNFAARAPDDLRFLLSRIRELETGSISRAEVERILRERIKEIKEGGNSIDDPLDDADNKDYGAYYALRGIASALHINLGI